LWFRNERSNVVCGYTVWKFCCVHCSWLVTQLFILTFLGSHRLFSVIDVSASFYARNALCQYCLVDYYICRCVMCYRLWWWLMIARSLFLADVALWMPCLRFRHFRAEVTFVVTCCWSVVTLLFMHCSLHSFSAESTAFLSCMEIATFMLRWLWLEWHQRFIYFFIWLFFANAQIEVCLDLQMNRWLLVYCCSFVCAWSGIRGVLISQTWKLCWWSMCSLLLICVMSSCRHRYV